MASAIIEFDDERVQRALQRLHNAVGDLRPVFTAIGEDWIESTKQRFVSGTAPDGSHWLLNTPATLEHKEGDRPLVDGGYLSDDIFPNVGVDFLEIGTSRQYAAMMQFGGTKDEFPYLWGDIPGREYLGASDDDIATALDNIEFFLSSAIGL